MNLFFLFLLILSPSFIAAGPAGEAYARGISATTYKERDEAFNQALALFYKEERTNPSESALDVSIGDLFFQFGEYAWAILYYERAMDKGASAEPLFAHLAAAKNKLGLREKNESPKSQTSLLFPFSDRALVSQGLLLALFVAFLALCSALWLPSRWTRSLACFFSFLFILLLGNYLALYYTTPLEGVVIKSSPVYLAPGWDKPRLKTDPFMAGEKIPLLGLSDEKGWVKTKNMSDVMGYIPADHVRTVQQ